MAFIVVGLLLCALCVAAIWATKRLRPRPIWATGVGIMALIILVVSAAAVGVYVWAQTATDTSQLARALVWGDSGFGDQYEFPARDMARATDPVRFVSAVDSPLAAAVQGPAGQALEELLALTGTTAFLVLHDDELLYENYFNDSDRDSLQTSFSVAKSFVATLVGIAIEDGSINDLDDPVTRYVPELAERDTRFDDITLRHLIVMASGLSFDDGASPWADPANTYHGTDLRSAVISVPRIEEPPGITFDYNDWNVILLGLVLERATGMTVTEYTETRLWQPMGAEADGSWSLDSERHGFEKMFVGVNGRAIDFAKLGWLYLNEGRNGTQQIVPAEFIRDATRLDTENDPAPEFQYLWWIDQEHDAYFANGDHGQFIYVDPEAEVVIVRHGTTLGDFDWISYFGELADDIAAEAGAR